MKKIRELMKIMLKIDKNISVGSFAKILNGQSIKIDLVV